MANNIFSDLASGKPTNIQPRHYIKAREWFRQAAQKISDIHPSTVMRQMKDQLVKQINVTSIGSMYLYQYDPKWKAKLPYYDTYPLIFVVKTYNDGWLGLNMHYLPPYARAKLMDALYTITIKEQDKMKVQLSYGLLASASRFKLFEPCVHRYLSNHVQSKLLFIEPSQWDSALMLPTARFVGASPQQVWKDSRSSQ